LVSPQNQSVVVYTLTEGKFTPSRTMASGDIISSKVLPGFQLNLSEVFYNIVSED
jgi:Uma2 family endonuclease